MVCCHSHCGAGGACDSRGRERQGEVESRQSTRTAAVEQRCDARARERESSLRRVRIYAPPPPPRPSADPPSTPPIPALPSLPPAPSYLPADSQTIGQPDAPRGPSPVRRRRWRRWRRTAHRRRRVCSRPLPLKYSRIPPRHARTHAGAARARRGTSLILHFSTYTFYSTYYSHTLYNYHTLYIYYIQLATH